MITTLAGLGPLLAPVTTPRLTWYGPDAERVDLSGRVLANWFVKAANLCALEADLAPGDRLWLDLPAHWRSLVWAVGAWTCGAEVVLTGPGAEAVVTATPDERTAGPDTQVVIALPSLAMRLPGPPPPDAIDGAAELTSQSDQLLVPAAADPKAPALGMLSHADVLAGEGVTDAFRLADSTAEDGARVLLHAPQPLELLATAPALWARGASLVLVGADHAGDVDRIRAAEAVTTG